MTVPETAHREYRFWERMENARQARRIVSGRLIKFFVQPTRADCVHACTIDDLARMLSYLPAPDWAGIGAVLLRQPRRKEQTLEAVWGRFSYAADLVDRNGNVLYAGPAIIIEAVKPDASIKFGKRLFPEGIAELERLKTDGHIIRSPGCATPRHFVLP